MMELQALWMSTNRGIAVFHIADEKVSAVIAPRPMVYRTTNSIRTLFILLQMALCSLVVWKGQFFEPGKVFSR